MPFKEASHFGVQMANQALCFQGVFAHFDNGQLEDETYYVYLAFFSGLVATPGGSRWWEEVGRPIFVRSAVAAVDECIAKGAFPEVLQRIYPMPDVDDQQ